MTTTLAKRPSLIRIAAAIIAFALASILVVRTSSAAFTANTTNGTNDFGAATIALTDDDTGLPLFSYDGGGLVDSSNMTPGQSVLGCIVVTYTGSLTGSQLNNVTLEANGAAGALGDYVTVEVGTADDDCATPWTFPGATLPSWVASVGTPSGTPVDTNWQPGATSESKSFYFRVTLDSSAPIGVMGATASNVTLTWSIQNA